MLQIRAETPADQAAIRDVHIRAFVGPQEAELVDALRMAGALSLSLIALLQDQPVAHIAFSPVTLQPLGSMQQQESPGILGLAPMAVVPEHQRQGIGTHLIHHALDMCRAGNVAALVVLGHCDYYPRFGFLPAEKWQLRCVYPVPTEHFMAMEFIPKTFTGKPTTVHYHGSFAAFE